ncbi:MAG: hypothetical protein Q4E65_08710 [Clostridia bacterium]|nr:hypothetical protein [Clostridia bacterium]
MESSARENKRAAKPPKERKSKAAKADARLSGMGAAPKKEKQGGTIFLLILVLLVMLAILALVVAYMYDMFGIQSYFTGQRIEHDKTYQEALAATEAEKQALEAEKQRITAMETELNEKIAAADAALIQAQQAADAKQAEIDEFERSVVAFNERRMDFNKLVEVVLEMKPADAATLMNDLSSVQCARVLAALDAKSAAKILAQMDDERAAAIGLYVVQYTN